MNGWALVALAVAAMFVISFTIAFAATAGVDVAWMVFS